MADSTDQINRDVVACRRCPRLQNYLEEIKSEKVRRFRNEAYWGRPVPGFGDPRARLLIIGLAPGAHGSNRTGRMFTGDASGEWLFGAMHDSGFASMPQSRSVDDGMTLKDAYITSVARCAPPGNKPLRSELEACSLFFKRELALFDRAPVVLCLGQIAWKESIRAMGFRPQPFKHRQILERPSGILMASYHPSRQNTQTGRLKWADWVAVFEDCRRILDAQ